jgi:diguanylate cyclase (GGDEF)-like protein/PAS domain S-box-containing protein
MLLAWHRRLLSAAGLPAALATGWFLLVLVFGAAVPAVVSWLLMPLGAAVATVACRRVGADPLVAPAARDFWRRLGFSLAVLTAAMVSHAYESIDGLGATARVGVLTGLLHAASVLLLVWPLFGLPVAAGSRARRVTVGLDLGILVAGAGIFFWHFAAQQFFAATASGQVSIVTSIGFVTTGLISVVAMAKVAITGSATLAGRSMWSLGAALLVTGFILALAPQLSHRPELDVTLPAMPLAGLLITYGALRQPTGDAAARGPRRRPSALPYLVAAATNALLITVVVQNSNDRIPVTVAAVVLTGLLVVRQLTALRENGQLLTRLDATVSQLGHKEQRFRLLVQNSTDVVTITEPDGRIRYISPAVQRVLGLEPVPLVGTNIAHRVHPDDRAAIAANVAHVITRPGNSATYQVRLRHADGTYRTLEIISVNLADEPSVGGVVSNSRDVTETVQAHERLSYEATHDVLTGLANRALFAERVAASVTHAAPGHRISIVLIDLDDFKTVNDTLGHAAGDGLLVAVAERMRAGVRPTDTIARLGGDEFAILFEGLDDTAVNRVLERIADALAVPVDVDGHLLAVRASFGVVDGRGGDDAGNLLRQADIAMYEAKERGEGGYQRYRPGTEARGAERSRLTSALLAALDHDELVLHYQPVVTLPEGRLTGVEALVRWEHPTRGLLGPGEFIPGAEQTGIIVPLGRWVLRSACRQAAAWVAELGADAPGTMAVNVSARQLQEPGFAAEVAAALADSGLEPRRLTIEITESTAVGGGATHQTLRELRAQGVRLSLDDFGTGASTLSLLAECPVDQIKLDRSFAPGPGPDAIAGAVLQLARAMGVEAVAEGVETPAQAARLGDLGYVRAQGFHFARPMTPEQLTAAITATDLRTLAGSLAARP